MTFEEIEDGLRRGLMTAWDNAPDGRAKAPALDADRVVTHLRSMGDSSTHAVRQRVRDSTRSVRELADELAAFEKPDVA